MSKLSIIVPVYNGSEYLDECIKSIIGQRYKDLQIILIDDGSTDNSLEILEKWKRIDFRIEVYSQPNSGVSVARNSGISHAKGEFITFVDCDDTVEPEMYSTLIDKFYDDSIDIVHCSYNKVPLNGEKYVIGGSGKVLIQNGLDICELLIKGKMITGSPCTKIYRKKLLEDIRFDCDLKINEDVLFNYYAMKKSDKVAFVDCGFYNYFERNTSSCKNTNNIKTIDDCVKVAEIIYFNEGKSKLELCSRNKYYMTLCRQFRTYIYANKNVKDCSQKIEKILKTGVTVEKKYIYDYWFMKKFPNIYKNIYQIYNRIRKPNWDV